MSLIPFAQTPLGTSPVALVESGGSVTVFSSSVTFSFSSASSGDLAIVNAVMIAGGDNRDVILSSLNEPSGYTQLMKTRYLGGDEGENPGEQIVQYVGYKFLGADTEVSISGSVTGDFAVGLIVQVLSSADTPTLDFSSGGDAADESPARTVTISDEGSAAMLLSVGGGETITDSFLAGDSQVNDGASLSDSNGTGRDLRAEAGITTIIEQDADYSWSLGDHTYTDAVTGAYAFVVVPPA